MLERRQSAVLLVSLIASMLFAGCKPANLISKSQEIDIGQAAAQDVEAQYPVDTDPRLNDLVNTIGQNLARYSTRPNLQYTFKILDIDEANAVSLPGGWVYVYKGLIDDTRNDPDELAGVIAHEIAHIAARHHADLMGRDLYAQLLIGMLTGVDIQMFASFFADLTLLRWSRKHEYEADELGIDFMYKSGMYDPQGLIDFFAMLEQEHKDDPSQFEQMFRTHPVTAERIKRAQQHLADLRSGRKQPK